MTGARRAVCPVVVLEHVDLGEIAAGGNGVDRAPPSGRIGLRPDTGEWSEARRGLVAGEGLGGPRGVPDSDFIDSVFLITGEKQAIHTGGLVYHFKPEDADGITWDSIRNGGEAGSGKPFHFQSTGPMTSGLGMHASSGITYDLVRLRKAFGAAQVRHFFAFAGVAKPKPSSRGLVNLHAIASTGSEVVVEWGAVLQAGNGRIFAGEIPQAARFLTLAAGAAGNGDADDLACFAHAMVAAKPVCTYSDLEFQEKSAGLTAGETFQCRVTSLLSPFGWRLDVTDRAGFSGTNGSVVKVTGSGSLTAQRKGTARINARFEGLKASMGVEVRSPR